MMNNPLYRELPSPSTHGFGTISSLASLMGIIANGGTDQSSGRQLLKPSVIRDLQQPLASGEDLVLLNNQTFGRGVSIKRNPLVSPICFSWIPHLFTRTPVQICTASMHSMCTFKITNSLTGWNSVWRPRPWRPDRICWCGLQAGLVPFDQPSKHFCHGRWPSIFSPGTSHLWVCHENQGQAKIKAFLPVVHSLMVVH